MNLDSGPIPLRDTDTLNLRVTRTIPVWAIVTFLGAVGAAAASNYYGQARQGDLIMQQSLTIKEQNDSIKGLSGSVGQLSLDLGKTNLKTVEYEFRISDLDRRTRTLEQQTPRR